MLTGSYIQKQGKLILPREIKLTTLMIKMGESSMKILVLGGSSFFGKKLVRKLINNGDNEVTIATRGNRVIDQDISSKVRQVVVDRTNINLMKQALGTENFDVIYDQICFNPLKSK